MTVSVSGTFSSPRKVEQLQVKNSASDVVGCQWAVKVNVQVASDQELTSQRVHSGK